LYAWQQCALRRTPYHQAKVLERLRQLSERWLLASELAVYSVLALLLGATILLALAGSAKLLMQGTVNWMQARSTFQVLDQLLLVLMLVEILHTVRISIQSQTLLIEPFLIVGLIASIRRVLVITLEAADMTKEDRWTTTGQSIFHASMIELGLLAALILVLVGAIAMLRACPHRRSSTSISEME
jgi:phosphate starvation-inducible membrane PsiE